VGRARTSVPVPAVVVRACRSRSATRVSALSGRRSAVAAQRSSLVLNARKAISAAGRAVVSSALRARNASGMASRSAHLSDARSCSSRLAEITARRCGVLSWRAEVSSTAMDSNAATRQSTRAAKGASALVGFAEQQACGHVFGWSAASRRSVAFGVFWVRLYCFGL